jgi:hypothetical protein
MYTVTVLCDDGHEVVYELSADSRREAEETAYWNAMESMQRPIAAEAAIQP